MLALFIVFTHVIGCLFASSAYVLSNDDEIINQYLDSVYWTIMSMSKVGLGDIVPQTIIQTIFSIFLVFIGVIVYAYILS